MNSHVTIEVFELHVLDRSDFNNARVVDQNVYPAEMLQSLLNGGLNLRRFHQVALDGQNCGVKALQVLFGTGKFFRTPRQEGDLGAAAAKLAGDLQPQTARAAGD